MDVREIDKADLRDPDVFKKLDHAYRSMTSNELEDLAALNRKFREGCKKAGIELPAGLKIFELLDISVADYYYDDLRAAKHSVKVFTKWCAKHGKKVYVLGDYLPKSYKRSSGDPVAAVAFSGNLRMTKQIALEIIGAITYFTGS